MIERNASRREQHHADKTERARHPVNGSHLTLDEHFQGCAFCGGGLGEAHSVRAHYLYCAV